MVGRDEMAVPADFPVAFSGTIKALLQTQLCQDTGHAAYSAFSKFS